MIYLALLLSNLFFSSQQSFAKYAMECNQGADCSNVVDSSGKKNGIEICKSGNTVRRKVTYRNDLKEGRWECFDQNGEVSEIREYKNDKINGLRQIWQPSIKKFEVAEYRDDEMNGLFTTYQTSHSAGNATITGIYKTTYKDGIKHGLQNVYDADGKLMKSICYSRGQVVDADKEPCFQKKSPVEDSIKTQGNPKEIVEHFASGSIKSKSELVGSGDYERHEGFYENGQLKISFKRKIKSNDLYSPDVYEFLRYADNGLVLEEGTCAVSPSQDFQKDYCSNFTGVATDYDTKKELLQTKNYLNGKPDGAWIFYDRIKQRKEIITFQKGNKKKSETLDMKTNKVLESQEFFDDGSIKK